MNVERKRRSRHYEEPELELIMISPSDLIVTSPIVLEDEESME